MKIILTLFLISIQCLCAQAQAVVSQLSTSANVFTVAGTRTQVWADPVTNSVIFIHRGNSDDLYYDISYDGGTTWILNRGPIYSSSTQRPRYPQAVIADPEGYEFADSSFVTFLAPVTDPTTWTGIVQGRQQIVNTFPSYSEVDSINTVNHSRPSGFTITKQGIIWSVDAQCVNDTIYNNILIVSKGTWNSGLRKYIYSDQFLNAPVVNTGGELRYSGCNIAFSPDGQSGYVVMNGNNGTISDSVYHPIIFHTSDGGQTWSAPINIDLAGIDTFLNQGTNIYTMGSQFDIAVDATGSLHLMCEILQGDNHWNGYAEFGRFGIFDISNFNSTSWKAHLVNLPQTYQGVFGDGIGDPFVYENNRPQVSIDSSGTKVFFTWADTDTLTFGITVNINPDIHILGFNTLTGLWTTDANYTTGSNADGASTFSNVSYYALTDANGYTIPVTYTIVGNSGLSTSLPVDHFYIGNLRVQDVQFTNPDNSIILTSGASGTRHLISGKVFYDINGNGIKDGAETFLASQKINVQPDAITLFTNSSGQYDYFSWAASGSHVFNVDPYQNWILTSDSASFTVPEDTVDQSGFDFGLNATQIQNDLEVSIAGGLPRCNLDVSYWINYENTGTTNVSGRVVFIIDSLFFVSSVPSPDLISGDTLFFNFTNMPPYTQGQVHVILHLPSSPGQNLNFTAFAQNDSLGNYFTLGENNLHQVILCSADPNDKSVNPEGIAGDHLTMYNDTLLYTIRFQNTGNDTAFTVIIRDTIDPSLDISTFHLTGSSHDVYTTVNPNRIVEFHFENILLPDSIVDLSGSNGFVQYRIQPLANISLPIEVNNTAYIYFDFNAPVQTNTVSNTLVLNPYVGMPREEFFDGEAIVIPNPFIQEATLYIRGVNQNKECRLRIMNVWGMLVIDKTFKGNSEKIYRGNLSPGIYLYQIHGENGQQNSGKFIIE